MCSPLGHALAALSIHVLTAPDAAEGTSLKRALVVVGAALAPDLDLLGRFIDGQNHHQLEFHSVGFAFLAGLVGLLLARRLKLSRGALAGSMFLAWTSHLVLDYLAVDTSPPIGLMALWPFSSGFYHFPYPLFLDIWRTLGWRAAWHDTLAVLWEVAVLTPLLLLSLRARSFGRDTFPWHGDLKASR